MPRQKATTTRDIFCRMDYLEPHGSNTPPLFWRAEIEDSMWGLQVISYQNYSILDKISRNYCFVNCVILADTNL